MADEVVSIIVFDKIARLFRFDQESSNLAEDTNSIQVPNLIQVLDLRKWYLSLSDEHRRKLHKYSTWFGTDGEANPLEQDVVSTSQTPQEYLKGVGSVATTQKDYDFAEMVLLSALEFDDESVMSTHFTYDSLIDLYYKQRDDRDDAIDRCVEYCKKDIEIVQDFVDEFGEVPRIPSFKRLAIIYEKQGKYKDAMNVCDQALEIGTTDGTKSGFEGRKERLNNKIS